MSRSSNLSCPFEPLYREFLIAAGQQPIWAHEGIVDCVRGVDRNISQRGRRQDGNAKGCIILIIVSWTGGPTKWEQLELRPIGRKVGKISKSLVAELAS